MNQGIQYSIASLTQKKISKKPEFFKYGTARDINHQYDGTQKPKSIKLLVQNNIYVSLWIKVFQ